MRAGWAPRAEAQSSRRCLIKLTLVSASFKSPARFFALSRYSEISTQVEISPTRATPPSTRPAASAMLHVERGAEGWPG